MITTLLDGAQVGCDWLLNLKDYPAPATPAPGLVAHRGAWDTSVRLENTLAAFDRARALGAWGIELDVHFTADGVPVVHHDADLLRLYKKDLVLRERPWSELQRAAPNLTCLPDVLRLAGLHFMIEIKTPLTAPEVTVLERALAGFTATRDFHLLVLDAALVRATSQLPKAAWILVAEVNTGAQVGACLDLDLGGVAGHYVLLTRRQVRRLKLAGKKVGVGFVPTRNLYRRAWGRDVDWVFTNHLSAIQNHR